MNHSLSVESVGLLAPGLIGWLASRAILTGEQPYLASPMPAPSTALLPPNERRRVTGLVKLALHVAQEAITQASADPQTVCSVFASSGGDSEVLDKICTALTLPDRPVSPTHFHQSVHNATTGYWSIATRCPQPSLSLSAYDSSFMSGLLEAATLAWAEAALVLLVAYDVPQPFPLSEQRVIIAPFGVALLLSPEPGEQRLATLHLTPTAAPTATTSADPELERLRIGNPAARCLPLLQAIARPIGQQTMLADDGGMGLSVEVRP
ncbi:MAG: beta-ketoacyl synthase chain length factor [Candidatus Contendobacter sp.]|jgi:hypothetical protein|nr:beta-ketoacyl synthase chain length factor [Gammaproteobacteria bacterium]MCC8994093.1 beta-ketoacyl synthase chain length factor [Candidatus Contendobacter sp.]